MAVVGAYHDVVFAGVAQDKIKVVVGFRRDINIEFLEGQLREAFGAGAASRFFDDPRYPLGRRLDETPTEFRKSFRHVAHHQ